MNSQAIQVQNKQNTKMLSSHFSGSVWFWSILFLLVFSNTALGTTDDKDETEKYLIKVLTIAEQSGRNDLIIASYDNLLKLYLETGNYLEAEQLYKHALEKMQRSSDQTPANLAALFTGLGSLYVKQGRFKEAENPLLQAINITANTFGPHHLEMVVPLNNQALLLMKQGQFNDAEQQYKLVLEIIKKAPNTNQLYLATSLNNLADLYSVQGKYSQAEVLLNRALEIYKTCFNNDHPDIANAQINLASLYGKQGKYLEAERLNKQSLDLLRKSYGENHPLVAISLNNQASIYLEQDKYAEAELILYQALKIYENCLIIDHPDIGNTLNNLAFLYLEQGKYRKAEELFKQALAKLETSLGDFHSGLAPSLIGLTELYRTRGKFLEAEFMANRALHLAEKDFGDDHPMVASSLNNLASVYVDLSKYSEAENLFNRALQILEKNNGKNHPSIAASLSLKASLFIEQDNYLEAELLLHRALEIRENSFRKNHSAIANSLNDLALTYLYQYKFSQAEPLFIRSLEIEVNVVGKDHPNCATILTNIAHCYDSQGLMGEAIDYWYRAIGNYRQQFIRYFPVFSEEERLHYIDAVDPYLNNFYSFCTNREKVLPELRGELLNVLLLRKALVLSLGVSERQVLIASGDTTSVAIIDKLITRKKEIARIFFNRELAFKIGPEVLDELRKEVSELEIELAERSQKYVTVKDRRLITWEQVRDSLKPGEVGVEFLQYRRILENNEPVSILSIVAVVVLPDSKLPTIIELGNLSSLKEAKNGYMLDTTQSKNRGISHTNQQKIPNLMDLYSFVWAPLDSLLEEAECIYLSSSGTLLEMNLGLAQSENKEYMMDRYELHYVNSLRQILSEEPNYTSKMALLVGNPEFEISSSNYELAMVDTHAQWGKRPPYLYDEKTSGGCIRTWGDLGKAQLELDKIDEMLNESNWETDVYVENNALEEIVKSAEGYRVLHLATHGFFCPNEDRELGTGLILENGFREKVVTDPLLRSGLVFSGANNLDSAAMRDDGWLTAYELKEINLKDTELVILSACDTGLGDISVGEGVFGLRRAFALAGAGAVVMSLWSVPDQETQELMTNFYNLWLGGQDKYTAFSNAQRLQREIVIERWDENLPYYWGAFVMVEN